MEALVNAGGKGTRMGLCGIEKPMQKVGGIPTIMRVVNALLTAKSIDRVVVSVSPNTKDTRNYLEDHGVETIVTSGEDFVDDLHRSFQVLTGKFVMTSPSDLPLLKNYTIDAFAGFFDRTSMESAIAVVDEYTVRSTGIVPSYTIELDGSKWVLSGLCIMDREKTLDGTYLQETYFKTDWPDLAVNVNTQLELDLARGFYD